MGLVTSRRSRNPEEMEASPANPYRYPPRSGKYFGNYFIMGGERFDTNQQDVYLFGENDDLNFLGNKPIPFPYPVPQSGEPTKTLKCLVNIRRDSLRFIRETENPQAVKEDNDDVVEPQHPRYNIEFTFDSDVRCAITIYYFATEEIVNKQAVYHPRDVSMNSETVHYKRGANQVFSQSIHIVDPAKFPEEDWQYSIDKEVIPIVIQCAVEEDEYLTHSHVTYGVVDKSSEEAYSLHCLKQKQFIDGVGYLLQEIYGIENKNTERAKDDDVDDNGSECVICMCEMRDTLILPCRHLCLCYGCADNLRYQANNCPICRAKFYALLQVRAMRRKVDGRGDGTVSTATASVSNRTHESIEDLPLSQEGIPAGYEAIPLIEALNGPTQPNCAPVVSTDDTLRFCQLSDSAGRGDDSLGGGDGLTTPASDVDKCSSYIDVEEVTGAAEKRVSPSVDTVLSGDSQPYFTARPRSYSEVMLSGASDTDVETAAVNYDDTARPLCASARSSLEMISEKRATAGAVSDSVSRDKMYARRADSDSRTSKRPQTAFTDPLTSGECDPLSPPTSTPSPQPSHAADKVSDMFCTDTHTRQLHQSTEDCVGVKSRTSSTGSKQLLSDAEQTA